MEKTYRGWLVEHSYGETDNILFLERSKGNRDEPLAMELKDDMEEYGQYLSVRYIMLKEEKAIDELTEDMTKRICGIGDIDYGDAYSEITGYLWTDEDIVVGGHDLLDELKSYLGMLCHLEIQFHKELPSSDASPFKAVWLVKEDQ